jgi:hypothetical protein
VKKLLACLFLIATAAAQEPPIGPIGGGQFVTGFGFNNANGFVGTVTNPNTTPVLTLSLTSGTIAFSDLAPITSPAILGRTAAGTGAVQIITASQVLDFIGNVRGDVIYRDAGGWAVLAPGTAGQVLTTGGPAANPSWTSSAGTVSTVSSGTLSPLFTTAVATATTTPAISYTLTNAGARTWFGNPTAGSAPPAYNATVVPYQMLGSGGDGSGSHFLGDDNVFHTLGGGGSVSAFSAGTLSPLFTTSVATSTTTPALSFILTAAAANSWFGNATGGSAAPAFNTSVFPAVLMPAFSGAITTSAGSTVTSLASASVTYAKIQNVAASRLLGNPTGSPAAPLEISIDGGMSFSSSTLRAFHPTAVISAFAIDASTAKSFTKTLTAGTNTFTWSNFNDGDSIVITLKQVASGTVGTVALPTLGADGAHLTVFQGGTQPTQTATFNKRDVYECFNVAGDVLVVVQQNF